MSWEVEFGQMIGIPYVDTSYNQDRTPDTVTTNIVSERQGVTTGGTDAWGAFFAKGAATLLDYGIKRDAALTSVQLQRAQQPNVPYYTAGVQAGAGGLTISPMLLVIGAVVAYVVLSK